MRLDEREPLLYHGETLLQKGRRVGRVTSGAYGYTIGGAVGFAAVEGAPEIMAEIVDGGDIEVDVADRRVPATLSRTPFYDPEGKRLKV